MCGRYTLAADPARIAKRFNVSSITLEEFKPSYNIPPSLKLPIIVQTPTHRRLESAVWGIKREWAPNIINLQAEKLLKGAFKKSLALRRCLIPADGFYEWGTKDGIKYPVRFQLKDGDLFGFPGLYDEGEPKTFLFFTIAPNAVVSPGFIIVCL